MPEFQETIISWYHQNKRNLPWRETTNPYFIWLSEIILQQTRIEQGTSYYLKFIKRFPTIKDLALANEQEVLNLWQGLGYYSRARNLHTTAKYIYFDLKGEFLTSIGKYVTYKISGYSFAGDANHGMPINEYYVLDYESQSQVFISQFIPKLSNVTISSIIYRQLRFGLGLYPSTTQEVPENLSYVSNEMQWWPEAEGIHFFFPVYSVASYADGPQEGFISWVDVRDEYPNSKNAAYAEIDSFITDTKLLYYLHMDENPDGTFIEVTKVENGTDASAIGFWWASEGIYFYKGKVGNQGVKYTVNYISGESDQFTYELLNKYPLTFNRDSKNNLRVAGPMSDLKYIDFLLNKLEAPIATDLFLDAEKAGWTNDDSSGGD